MAIDPHHHPAAGATVVSDCAINQTTTGIPASRAMVIAFGSHCNRALIE
jgi:hypothetical protein